MRAFCFALQTPHSRPGGLIRRDFRLAYLKPIVYVRKQLYAVRLKCLGEKQKETSSEIVDDLRQQLEVGGIDEETAKKILAIWSTTGIDDTEKLKKLLLSQSYRSLALGTVQLLLDLGAAYGAYYTGAYWTRVEEFGGLTPFATAIIFLLAGYFFAGAFFDVFTLGILTYATYQFQANSTAFLLAVRQIAGTSGLGVVDKATQAANTLKVVDALNKIADALKEDAQSADKTSTLADLSAYLVLDTAEKKYGFSPDKYGLTNQEAGIIAMEFAKFDTNDDGRLELSELLDLSRNLDASLSEEEAKSAIKLLDKRGSGYVEFDEFVEWWLKKVQPLSQ